MGSNIRDKQTLQMFPESDMSAFFVCASQTAVTGCIGRKDGNEPSQKVFASQGLLLAKTTAPPNGDRRGNASEC
jgi:hypothetical protein